MNIGDTVIFTGCSEDQHRWGNHTGNLGDLILGSGYVVKTIKIHSEHTKVYLEGVSGSFNSVCFDEIPREDEP